MKAVILVFFLLCGFSGIQAQDRILTRAGDVIYGKVLEVTSVNIKYLRLADSTIKDTVTLAKDTLGIAVADVFLIRYRNGSKTVFELPASSPPVISQQQNKYSADASNNENYEMLLAGERDAAEYYKPTGVFLASAVSGFIGGLTFYTFPTNIVTAAPPAIFAVTPPSKSNLNIPDTEAFQNTYYRRGYIEKAESKKRLNAAAGYGAGLVTGLGTLLVAFMGFYF